MLPVFTFFAFVLSAFISWIVFARVTVAKIERELKKEGRAPGNWDGPGFRMPFYASAIVLPVGRLNPANNPLVDVLGARKHATGADRIRAAILLVSLYGMVIFALLAKFLEW